MDLLGIWVPSALEQVVNQSIMVQREEKLQVESDQSLSASWAVTLGWSREQREQSVRRVAAAKAASEKLREAVEFLQRVQPALLSMQADMWETLQRQGELFTPTTLDIGGS